MRKKLVVITLCLILCSISLFACEQSNGTVKQSPSPDISEAVSSGGDTAPSSSASADEPSAEPSDDAGSAVTISVPQETMTPEVGVNELRTNIEYCCDLDGDGTIDTLLLRNNDPQWSCDVLFNGEKINGGDDWTSISQAHLMCRDDASIALIYQQNGDDGCCTTSIYTFTNGKATKTAYRYNDYQLLSTDTIQLAAPVFYFLGNQRVTIDASVNDDFTLTLGNDGWFKVIPAFDSSIPEREYIAKVDVPMQRLDNGEYVDATLPAGTRVYPQLINEAETQMIMKTDDGTLWMYTRDSAGLHFEEGDLFDGCTYAGP